MCCAQDFEIKMERDKFVCFVEENSEKHIFIAIKQKNVVSVNVGLKSRINRESIL